MAADKKRDHGSRLAVVVSGAEFATVGVIPFRPASRSALAAANMTVICVMNK